MTDKTKTVLKNIIKFTLVILLLYFIGKKISEHWVEIVAYEWNIDYPMLLLSVLLHAITFMAFSKVWCYLISGFGYTVPLKYGFKLAYIGTLGRYLPGKVWSIFGMAYLAKKIGIKEEESISSWIIVIVFSLPTAFLISFVTLMVYPSLMTEQLRESLGYTFYYLSALTLIGSLILIIVPNKAFGIFNVVLKKIGRHEINFKITPFTALKIYIGYTISWLLFGISFYYFLQAITVEPTIPFFAAAGAYVFAYQIGFVAIFSPGGVGIREFAMLTILDPYFGSVSVGIAVAARLWNIVVELLSAVVALWIKLPQNNDQ